MTGWTLRRESVRHLTHATAQCLPAARNDRNDADRFARADGVIEVGIGR